MKMSAMSLAAAMLLVAVEGVTAIPQSFGAGFIGGFGQAVGEAPEEYFSGNPGAWLSGAELPGEWVAANQGEGEEAGTGEVLKGKETVFGVVASGLRTGRGKDGALATVVAIFTRVSSGKSPAELKKVLEANVGAFTGVAGVRGKDGMEFAGAKLVVTLSGAKGGGVVATMRRP